MFLTTIEYFIISIFFLKLSNFFLLMEQEKDLIVFNLSILIFLLLLKNAF